MSKLSAHEFVRAVRASNANLAAKEEWTSYREQMTALAVSGVSMDDAVAVFGAGAMNDLSLEKLCAECRQVLLFDIDEDAMNSALGDAHKGNDQNKIKTICSDFTGISDSDYSSFAKVALDWFYSYAGGDENATADLLSGELEIRLSAEAKAVYEANRAYVLDFGDRICDRAIVLGVHSQLNNTFTAMWGYLMENLKRFSAPDISAADAAEASAKSNEYRAACRIYNALAKLQSETMPAVVSRFNEAVIKAASDTILVGYELRRHEYDGSPIAGAYEGAIDLNERVMNGELKLQECYSAVWPLDSSRNIVYDMVVGVFTIPLHKI